MKNNQSHDGQIATYNQRRQKNGRGHGKNRGTYTYNLLAIG
jgi:hypothetical protein